MWDLEADSHIVCNEVSLCKKKVKRVIKVHVLYHLQIFSNNFFVFFIIYSIRAY